MTAVKWILFFLGSAFLYLGLTETIIIISVKFEAVITPILRDNPGLGLLLQANGQDVGKLLNSLPKEISNQSIISSVDGLYSAGSFLAATIILIFSVIFPILKQGVILLKLSKIQALPRAISVFVDAVHKWAMIDVFVISSVVIALSNAPAWDASLDRGFYWFIAYFFTTALLMYLTKPKPATT